MCNPLTGGSPRLWSSSISPNRKFEQTKNSIGWLKIALVAKRSVKAIKFVKHNYGKKGWFSSSPF